MDNIFKNFKKLSENQTVNDWIKENKEDIFKLKRNNSHKWKDIAEDLTVHLGQENKIRPSVLTEKLTLHYFLDSPKFKKKHDY